VKIPIVGQAYTARSLNLASQQCINLYPEISEVNGQISALYGTPGLRLLTTLPGTGGTRGGYVPATGRAIIVQGNKVYRLDGNMNYAQCAGELLTTSGTVSITDNGTTAVIVDGNYGYALDLASSVITRIINDAFTGSTRVSFISGYFVFIRPASQVFYWSYPPYSTDFDGLDFASTEGNPDFMVSQIVDHSEVWFFNAQSTEVYRVTANPDQPIESTGAFIEHGCAAAQSVAKLDNTVFWIGQDSNGNGAVWRANGYTPQRISTHAIEYAIQSYGVISDAIAYTYQQDGHAFYVLTFPSASKTWCYDVSTGGWHERAYRNTTTGDFERHRSNWLIFFGGNHIVGDYADGRLYALDPDYYTDDGDPLVAVRSAPVVSNSAKRLFHTNIQVEVESGVGLDSLRTNYNTASYNLNSITQSNELTDSDPPAIVSSADLVGAQSTSSGGEAAVTTVDSIVDYMYFSGLNPALTYTVNLTFSTKIDYNFATNVNYYLKDSVGGAVHSFTAISIPDSAEFYPQALTCDITGTDSAVLYVDSLIPENTITVSTYGLNASIEEKSTLPIVGYEPKLKLSWSDDFGRTWSNGRVESMGRLGEYKKRVKFWRLGMARDRVYRVEISDPVKRVILAAELEATGGKN